MKRLWAICLFEMKRVLKQPASYALMFGMPLLFTFIFGGLLGDSGTTKFKLAIVDQDQSVVSKDFSKLLEQNNLLEIDQTDQADAQIRLKDKKISGIVQIPASYQTNLVSGNQTQVLFQHGPDLAIAPAIKQTIENGSARLAIELKAAQAMSRHSGSSDWQSSYKTIADATAVGSVTVEAKTVTKNNDTKKMNNVSERAIGFSIMFLMFTLMSVSGTFLQSRKIGVWYRLLSTPVSRLEIVGGYLLSFFLLGWLQFGILMVCSNLLFDVQWGNIAGEIMLVSALLLCVIGLGLFIAGMVRTTEQQSAISNILIVSTCMLGGVYWPLDIVPDVMKTISEFVPQAWAMKGFTELVARGGAISDILLPVAVLLGFACVFLGVGVSRVRYE